MYYDHNRHTHAQLDVDNSQFLIVVPSATRLKISLRVAFFICIH